VAEWGGLENRCGLMGHRGFESHPLRSNSRCPIRDNKKPDDYDPSGFKFFNDRTDSGGFISSLSHP
jgi:hypothetical protein